LPVFRYKGYDAASGALKKGSVEADSAKSARARLRTKDKIIVSEIKEETTSSSQAGGKSVSARLFAPSERVGLSELSVMTRQFATLQQAHVPLDESLAALVSQVENQTLRTVLGAVKDLVVEGRNLADAVSKFPKIFNRLYVNMIRAGEQSGTLGVVLQRLADFQEYQVAIRGQIMSALAYPAIMILASTGIIAYLFVSVVPKLQKVFVSLKVKLPWYTEILITLSEGLQKNWVYVLIALGLLVWLFKRWRDGEKGRAKFDHSMLTLPVLGPLVMRINTSKFTRTLSTLLSSGVPIINALDITKNIIGNTILAKVVEDAKIAVQEGGTLAASLAKSELFPPMVTHMIRTGEKTGQLEEMLNHVAKAYDNEVERKIGSLISMIEPLMIIVMAMIVTVIIIALLIPMLGVMNQMR
jgi:general secretion pathway protein F